MVVSVVLAAHGSKPELPFNHPLRHLAHCLLYHRDYPILRGHGGSGCLFVLFSTRWTPSSKA